MNINRFTRLCLLLTLFIVLGNSSFAQKKTNKKYPALLWEISGNGMKHKSYLFGTMHISNKMVFNLSDSFFYALKSVDKVGLEVNPDHWQDDMIRSENEKDDMVKYTDPNYRTTITQTSFTLNDYGGWLSTLLKMQPSIINSLLYRNYNKYNEDYEEDTFLDLYIYQAGKKLGKTATGMEHMKTNDVIQIDAYRDMLLEKKKAKDNGNTYRLREKMEDAYRNQDLDVMDSLEKIQMQSEAYMNRFLYYRNIIQANSMDTILKGGASLFVGVGCAHLPGEKGVIELLRKKGYTLRPIRMNERDAKQKEEISKMRCPVVFKTYKSEDGRYQVDMPGKPYDMSDSRYFDSRQYSDMSNGSYYMVTRLRTHALLIGDDEKKVRSKIDSLLYENIPGNILSKKSIQKDGYDGIEVINKTRRGDVQRYNIFVLPDEVMVFKMSGPYDYLQNGNEADLFFNSIHLSTRATSTAYQNYKSPSGDFTIELPVSPFAYLNKKTFTNVNRWEYEVTDPSSGNSYGIWHTARHNFTTINDDSTILELMNISLYQSEAVVYPTRHVYFQNKGYANLAVTYKMKDSSYLFVQNIIRGPHQYVLFFHSKNAASDERFFNSFNFTPFQYNSLTTYTDQVAQITCQTPFQPKIDTAFRRAYLAMNFAKDNFVNGVEKLEYWQDKQNIKLVNDSTMETVFIQTRQLPVYFYVKSMDKFWKKEIEAYYDSTTHILKYRKPVKLADGTSGYDVAYTDTGATQLVKIRFLLKGRLLLYVLTVSALNEPESVLTNTTFNSVLPNVKAGNDPITKSKLPDYFRDFYSTDEKTRTKARNWISNIVYNEEGISDLLKAYRNYKPEEKDFYENKTKLVREFGFISDTLAGKQLMKAILQIYDWSSDTSMFQNQVFNALARIRSKTAYNELKQLLVMDPPVFDNSYELKDLFNLLSDSLNTTKVLFPEILQLSALDDYKDHINSLLELMIDSNKISAKDYESYFSKLFFDAKINLKKQFAKDEEMIKTLSDKDEQEASRSKKYFNSEEVNDDVVRDFKLLAPFCASNPMVRKYFDKALLSKNNLLVLDAITALAKNKVPLPDSILNKLAANTMYSYNLYQRLGTCNAEALFPQKYKTQKLLTYSQVFYEGDYKLLDTIVFLNKTKTTVNHISGYVYVYKYRLDHDGPWYLAFCGVQPLQENKTAYNGKVDIVKIQIDDKLPLQKQIDKAIAMAAMRYVPNGRYFFKGNLSYDNDND